LEQELKNLEQEALSALQEINNLEQLKTLFTEYLGRKGKLTHILRGVKDLPAEQKPTIGKLSNVVKTTLEKHFNEKQEELEQEKLEKELNEESQREQLKRQLVNLISTIREQSNV